MQLLMVWPFTAGVELHRIQLDHVGHNTCWFVLLLLLLLVRTACCRC
jgi:cytochrome c biogenesis protein ResB